MVERHQRTAPQNSNKTNLETLMRRLLSVCSCCPADGHGVLLPTSRPADGHGACHVPLPSALASRWLLQFGFAPGVIPPAFSLRPLTSPFTQSRNFGRCSAVPNMEQDRPFAPGLLFDGIANLESIQDLCSDFRTKIPIFSLMLGKRGPSAFVSPAGPVSSASSSENKRVIPPQS
jgi:hypothetical protein